MRADSITALAADPILLDPSLLDLSLDVIDADKALERLLGGDAPDDRADVDVGRLRERAGAERREERHIISREVCGVNARRA